MLYSLTQSRPTLCNPTDYSPPGFSLHGILQAITLEWVAMPSSRGYSRLSDQTRSPALLVDSLPSEPPGYKQWINKYGTVAPRRHRGLGSFNRLVNWSTHTPCFVCVSVSVHSHSHVRLFATPWTAARQASLFNTNSRSSLKFMSIESVMPSNHIISVVPFSCLQYFPASGSFLMSQFCFESVSASI